MNINALFRMGVQWAHNVRLNRQKRTYRRHLIQNIPNAIPLLPLNLKKKHHRVGPLKIEQFNHWTFGDFEVHILERSHPKAYKKLLHQNEWNSITQNNTGAAIAIKGNPPSHKINAENNSLAIAGCLLTGFEHAEQWLKYYLSCPEVKAIYWYVNAPVAPQSFVEMTARFPEVQLIPWDFDFFKRKNHYLNTFQPGHALPGAYADSKYRAISEGHSHLLHIDLDEYIYPISGLSNACREKPVHFLNAYGANLTLNLQGLDLDKTMHLDVEHSTSNNSLGVGTSGNPSSMSYGKTVSPLTLDAVAPDNHCMAVSNSADLDISHEAVMLHFLDMEGKRTYPLEHARHPLSSLEPKTYTKRHWAKSAEFTLEYAVYKPLKVLR